MAKAILKGYKTVRERNDAIFVRKERGEATGTLAAEFGLNPHTIRSIHNRKRRWAKTVMRR
jgi:hypothetical protein